MSFKWRDNSIRILSLFIAILLWVYVTNEQNPVTDQTFSIPLVAQGAPQGYVVEGIPGTVSVRVRGTRVAVGTLQREDFTARVNLDGIKTGENDIAVQVTAPPEVEVLQVSPSVVKVLADRIEQKNVPVAVNLQGTVAEGMQAGEPVVQPQAVKVRGPATSLANLNRLNVPLDIAGAEETIIRELPLETGLEDVTVTPERVTVTLPVTTLSVQSLPVRLRLTGEPAAGYEVIGTTVSPQTVQVTARDDVLRNLTAVSTMTLDITGVSGDVEREVVLMLPDGARGVEPDQVLVRVRISRVEEEQSPSAGDEGENNTENDTGTGIENR